MWIDDIKAFCKSFDCSNDKDWRETQELKEKILEFRRRNRDSGLSL